MNDSRPDSGRPDDADLRRLFAETTEGIRPLGTLDDIRTRTEKVDPMARRWFLPSIAAAAVMALVIGGAFWLTQDKDDPNVLGPADTPSATVPNEPNEPADPNANRGVPVYYAGDAARGTRLFREFQDMMVCAALDCLPSAAVAAAVAGTPDDPDYRTLWPSGAQLEAFEQTDDLLTVTLGGDLRERPAGMSAEDAGLAVEQVIYTVQAAVGRGRLPVQFLLNGGRTDMILGVPVSEPLAAGEELDVLAPVQISSPGHGQVLQAGKVTVEGVAAVFEANVIWELLVGGDAVVDSGFTTAEECCTFAPYSFDLDLEPGTYTIVVRDEDMSGEGRPVNTDTREFVVE